MTFLYYWCLFWWGLTAFAYVACYCGGYLNERPQREPLPGQWKSWQSWLLVLATAPLSGPIFFFMAFRFAIRGV